MCFVIWVVYFIRIQFYLFQQQKLKLKDKLTDKSTDKLEVSDEKEIDSNNKKDKENVRDDIKEIIDDKNNEEYLNFRNHLIAAHSHYCLIISYCFLPATAQVVLIYKQHHYSIIYFHMWAFLFLYFYLFNFQFFLIFYKYVVSFILKVQFRALNCVYFDHDDNAYLKADTSIDCNGPDHQQFIIIDVFLICLYQVIV